MAFKCWKKVVNRNDFAGRSVIIVYKKVKSPLSVELFRDLGWGKTDNMNVIVRDSRKKSYMSRYGKDKLIKYFETRAKAETFANSYMKKNDKC